MTAARDIYGFEVKERSGRRWDLVALGEVMLRLDPGENRVARTRDFRVWEGGGEYNVARGLKRCFGMNSAVVSALVDNPVGRLVEDLIFQGGVDSSHVLWVKDDGVGRQARNGLNFTERGFGLRGATGCSDRGHTAVSQLKPGDIDWHAIFANEGCRWFHTGGIFSALSESTPQVAAEAMRAAKQNGVVISYDLNYRSSLWKSIGGQAKAQSVNRELMRCVDVVFGNEEDFSAALGFRVEGLDENFSALDTQSFRRMMQQVTQEFPNLKIVASTLRRVETASRNDWGAVCFCQGKFHEATQRKGLEILDRVGGGDSFASGLIYGVLSGKDPAWALECGAAHGALAMTTPGDTSMATLAEVQNLMSGGSARIVR
jgi:2-dehydro-3-deoxygluconokinase